jgi:hypothetical protein
VTTWRLTSDGAFTLGAPAGVIDAWLPRSAVPSSPGEAHLEVQSAPLALAVPSRAPLLSLLGVQAWLEGDLLLLRDRDGRLEGRIDLVGRRGQLSISTDPEPLLTVASAFLLGRLGRALVHTAGVVAPRGGLWLLAGDTHAGKSTTLATLVDAGWGWVADDQVIVRADERGVRGEGWPRALNLDAGGSSGPPTGRRVAVPPPLERWCAGELTIRGLLLPAIEADRPTELSAAGAADGYAALVRQSPWLLADRHAASSTSALFTALALLPVRRLRLGLDTYRQPERLATILAPLIDRA